MRVAAVRRIRYPSRYVREAAHDLPLIMAADAALVCVTQLGRKQFDGLK
jgi:hypothetical protein